MNSVTKAIDADMFRTRYELLIDAGDCTDLIVRELIQIDPLGGEEYPSTIAEGFDDDAPVVSLMELAYALGSFETSVSGTRNPCCRATISW